MSMHRKIYQAGCIAALAFVSSGSVVSADVTDIEVEPSECAVGQMVILKTINDGMGLTPVGL